MSKPIKSDVMDKYRAKAVTTSSKATLTESMFGIIGAAGVGKTSLLLSASKFYNGFPNKDYNKETGAGIIELKDLGVVQIDPGATDGYRSAGYDVGIIQYRTIKKDVGDPEQAAMISLALLDELQKDINGLDSVSQFDEDEFNYLKANSSLYMSEAGKVDTRAMWDLLRSAHGAVYNRFIELGGLKVFIGHTKAITEDLTARTSEAKDAVSRKEKINLAGNASITLDVTGKSERNWIRLNSLQIGVRVVEDPRTRALNRVLETEYRSNIDMAVKNRFSNIIGPNPEFSLKKIVDTIRGTSA